MSENGTTSQIETPGEIFISSATTLTPAKSKSLLNYANTDNTSRKQDFSLWPENHIKIFTKKKDKHIKSVTVLAVSCVLSQLKAKVFNFFAAMVINTSVDKDMLPA